MENKGLKVIGTAVIVAGLMTGAFLASGLATGGSEAEPNIEPTATATPLAAEEEDGKVVILVGDEAENEEQGDSKDDNAGAQDEPAEDDEDVAPPAPTQAPPEPTPAPPTPEPTPVLPTPEPTPVNEAPYVVSIAPADNEVGVELDENIVVTFSEAMDKASVQAAFNLSTGNCGAFSWNGASTVMTFNPCGDFTYGTEVEVEIYASAADADGLGMDDEFDSEFDVLKQSTIKLRSEDAYDGYVYGPGVAVIGSKVKASGGNLLIGTWKRGFLSFDLSELPDDVVDVQTAVLGIRQKSHDAQAYTNATGWLLTESVTYGTLSADDWFASSNVVCTLCIVPILSSEAANGWKTVNVGGYVKGDWEHREARDYNSQFRLRFGNDCGDGLCADVDATFYSGRKLNGINRPYLEITFTHP